MELGSSYLNPLNLSSKKWWVSWFLFMDRVSCVHYPPEVALKVTIWGHLFPLQWRLITFGGLTNPFASKIITPYNFAIGYVLWQYTITFVFIRVCKLVFLILITRVFYASLLTFIIYLFYLALQCILRIIWRIKMHCCWRACQNKSWEVHPYLTLIYYRTNCSKIIKV